jgi:hypothetical protein
VEGYVACCLRLGDLDSGVVALFEDGTSVMSDEW